MGNMITIDIDDIKQKMVGIVQGLDADTSIVAHYLLKGLVSGGNGKAVNDLTFRQNDAHSKQGSSDGKIDLDRIRKSYISYLISNGNSDSTVKNYSREIERFITHLKERKLQVILVDFELVTGYLAVAKKKRNLSQNTYSKLVVIMKGFLKFLYQSKIISEDISSVIRTPKKVRKEREYLSEEDIKIVENYLNKMKGRFKGENIRNSVIIYLGIYCGLRKTEIINLEWKDVDFKEQKIKILNSKNGDERIVHFGKKLKEKLSEYRKIKKHYKGAVILGNLGKRITSTSLHNTIKKIYKKSGIYRDKLCIHSLRHTFAVLLIKKDTDMHTIKTLMGHKSLDTTDQYLHSLGVHLKEALIDL